jgi:hypothetical protein
MLIDEIIDLLSRDDGSLSDALLKTKVLLHRLGKKGLVVWVNAELNGYEADAGLPTYRVVAARVLANIAAYTFRSEGHAIPLQHLSENDITRLQSHEVRAPVGLLEGRDKESKLTIPLPMEANALLAQGLANGVHINSAWCELNEQEIKRIPINVRSRLLDFALELRDAIGDDAGDSEIVEKSKHIDTQSMFYNAIFGPNATVIYSGASSQINVDVKSGNLVSLETALGRVGVPTDEIEALKQAIADDKATGRTALDGKAGNWFTKLLGKAMNGTVSVGVDVVSSTVAKALTTYLQGS